jgi:hypothetical protein
MNKNIFAIIFWIVLFFILLTLGVSYYRPVKAQTFPDLTLKVVKGCNIFYAGDSCITYIDLKNETGKILDGEAILNMTYNGGCNSTSLEGIGVQFSETTEDWKSFSEWKDNISSIKGFKIKQNTTKVSIKVNTISNLCPGSYSFDFQIIGKNGIDEFITPPISISSSSASNNSAVGGQYNTNYILELQIQILKLKIQIMNVLIQLKNMGRVILNF